MDFLGDILEPYSDQIAKFAGTVTCLQFLSGVILLNDIRKLGISDSFTPDPFVGGLVLTVLSLKLGAIMNDAAMIQVNLIGLAINVAFTSVFYYYATKEFRKEIHKKFGYGTIVTLIILAYAAIENPENIEARFGFIITSILVALVGSPLLKINDIIKNKSTLGMPLPIIASGTIVSGAWAAYGISIRNNVVIYQNLLLLFLSGIQLLLILLFPGKPAKTVQRQQEKKEN